MSLKIATVWTLGLYYLWCVSMLEYNYYYFMSLTLLTLFTIFALSTRETASDEEQIEQPQPQDEGDDNMYEKLIESV